VTVAAELRSSDDAVAAAPRHLAYVLKRFPRISETFIAAELLELQRQGEHVTVFAISRPAEPFTHAFLDEFIAEVVYLPHRPLRELGRVLRALGEALGRDPLAWLRAARYVLRTPQAVSVRRLAQATVLQAELRDRGVDHVHAHFATAAARLACLCRQMGGPSYSVTAHAKDIYHEDVDPAHLRDRLAGATFVATVSRANARHLADILEIGDRLTVVRNSVDVTRIPVREADRAVDGAVLVVARLVEKKGLSDVVDAAALLAARGVPVRVEVIGEGPLRRVLERRAQEAGAPVAFLGALPHEQVLERMRDAAVFCLPCVVAADGDRDGLPTSVLEAMAVGVPVVSTGVNGLEEAVVHERTGLRVPERDPEALADSIQRLLHDRSLARLLAANARAHVGRGYALEESVHQLRELFPSGAREARCV
jgi:colanic acid/amylovoran biosynthesis glycosyltransferase